MKITSIEVVTLRCQYPEGRGFCFAGGYCNARLSSLVRVRTDAGIEGLGSVYSHPELVRVIVEGHLQPILSGEDPCQTERLWELMYRATRWYGRKGVAVSALGGVDTALWDIRGKVAGKPVWQLLGGHRTCVPAYASGLLWRAEPQELAREAKAHVSAGFRAMKMRLGRDYNYDRSALSAVRDSIGPDVRLMVDGNARYTLRQAERIAALFEEAGVFWFEEPFAPEDLDNYLAFQPACSISLAAGENEFGLPGFRELIEKGVLDIVQPDCSRCGGITECLRIGSLAARAGLQVATHTWSDAIALVANMHFVAAIPNGLMAEIDQTGNPLVDELLTEPLNIREGGQVELPLAPGLGVELRPDALERFEVPRCQPFPNGNYSDMVFGREFWQPAGPYEDEAVGARDTSERQLV